MWPDGRITMWRKAKEEHNPKNLLLTVKHGGGGIMVWGYFAASSMGNLMFIENNMNQYLYINTLKENLKISKNLEFKSHSNCTKIMIPNKLP